MVSVSTKIFQELSISVSSGNFSHHIFFWLFKFLKRFYKKEKHQLNLAKLILDQFWSEISEKL